MAEDAVALAPAAPGAPDLDQETAMSHPPTGIPAGFRPEHDTTGDVLVPADARHRARTRRAAGDVAISGTCLHPRHVAALAASTRAAALADAEPGVLPGDVAAAVAVAAEEPADGGWADQLDAALDVLAMTTPAVP